MDDVTRPKRAARQRSGSAIRDNEVETDEESLPSSARDADSDQEDEGPESSCELDLPTQREPDPRASRHSGRKAAQKAVNYSTKHHPQDYGLPGYKHKAKQQKRSHDSGQPNASRDSQQREETTGAEEPASDDAEHLLAEVVQPKRPRKSLRVLEEGREHTSKAKARKRNPKKSENNETTFLPDMSTDAIDEMVDMVIAGSQLPQAKQDRGDAEGMDSTSNNGLTKTPTSSAGAGLKKTAQAALVQVPPSSMSSDAEEDPAGDLERIEGLVSSPRTTGQADSQLDDSFYMMDGGAPSDTDDHVQDVTDTGHAADSLSSSHSRKPVARVESGDAAAASRLRALETESADPQVDAAALMMDDVNPPDKDHPSEDAKNNAPRTQAPVTTTQSQIDHNFSSSSDNNVTGQCSHTLAIVQTGLDVATTVLERNSQTHVPQSTSSSSHTLAGLSHRGASSPPELGNHQHETQTQGYGAPSEFEEQFAVTERQCDMPRTAELDQPSSEGYYANLPVSQLERSEDHDHEPLRLASKLPRSRRER